MNKNIKTALILGGIILAILIIAPLVSGGYGWSGGWGMMGPGMMGGYGGMWFMPIFMIIFWGLVIWAIVALILGLTSSGGTEHSSEHSGSALEVLKTRYAHGEISKEEYEAKKKDLI